MPEKGKRTDRGMQRVPEPELMNEKEQVEAYALADFSAPNTLFVEIFSKFFSAQKIEGRVVDLGCGPADILIRFAKAFPECNCIGVDGASNMLDYGQKAIEAAGLEERVSLMNAVLPINKIREKYDVILSNSLLHHLSNGHHLWQTIREMGKLGTAVLVMDLYRPESEEAALKIVNRYSADEPQILKNDFFHSLLAAYSVSEVAKQLQQAGMAHLQVEKVSDRHFCVVGNL